MSAIGTFSSVTPPAAVIAAYQRLFAWKFAIHGVDPRKAAYYGGRAYNAISGHRDVYSTECPGQRLYDQLPAIRSGTIARMGTFPRFDNLVAAGDVDGDGQQDLVANASDGTLYLYPGNRSTGGFRSRSVVGGGWQIYDRLLGVGDWNGDGVDDLVARDRRTGDLFLYRGARGRAAYAARVQIGTGFLPYDSMTAAGDVNGDGHPDLVIHDGDGKLRLYPGNGGTGFLSPSIVGAGWWGINAVVGRQRLERRRQGRPDRAPAGRHAVVLRRARPPGRRLHPRGPGGLGLAGLQHPGGTGELDAGRPPGPDRTQGLRPHAVALLRRRPRRHLRRPPHRQRLVTRRTGHGRLTRRDRCDRHGRPPAGADPQRRGEPHRREEHQQQVGGSGPHGPDQHRGHDERQQHDPHRPAQRAQPVPGHGRTGEPLPVGDVVRPEGGDRQDGVRAGEQLPAGGRRDEAEHEPLLGQPAPGRGQPPEPPAHRQDPRRQRGRVALADQPVRRAEPRRHPGPGGQRAAEATGRRVRRRDAARRPAAATASSGPRPAAPAPPAAGCAHRPA